MTQVTNAFSSYDANGNAEDFEDIIYNVDPDETPVVSTLGRIKVKNRVHQWQTDNLAAAAQNAQLEGDAFALAAQTATVTRSNNTQIAYKVLGVTGTQQAIEHYGRENELDYLKVKKGKELKRDMEFDVCANNAKVTGDDSTPREFAGFESWVATNVDKASDGTNPTGDGTDARTDGTQRAFTEAQLKSVLQLGYTNGANFKLAVVGAFNRQKMSEFSGNANRQIDANGKKLVASIKVYESDFGTIKIVPDRFSRSRSCLLIDPEFAKLGILRPMKDRMLPVTSDTEQAVLLTEYTLVIGNEKAHGIVADLTTS